jgi:hypothetical protein
MTQLGISTVLRRYEASFRYWLDINDGGWQDWFNPDLPADWVFPTETEFRSNVIAEMLEAGETYWSHPSWIRDVWTLLREWSLDGLLIRVRLFAQWLITTLPEMPLDPDLHQRLSLLATGEFCTLFEGEYSLIKVSIE